MTLLSVVLFIAFMQLIATTSTQILVCIDPTLLFDSKEETKRFVCAVEKDESDEAPSIKSKETILNNCGHTR